MDNTDDQEVPPTDATEEMSPPDMDATADAQANGQLTGESGPTNAETETAGDAHLTAENPALAISNTTDGSSDENPSSTPSRASGLLARRQAVNPISAELSHMNGNIDMPVPLDDDEMNVQLEYQRTRTQTPDPEQIIAGEGPLTPRNNAGPFVFDGSAGRSDGRQSVVPGIPEVTEGDRAGSF